jgi:tRNA(Ile2) C34 agmatinyltransferase TiaS
MGLFSVKLPKCPHCGGPTVRTGYSYPYPQLRCNSCYQRNKEIQEMEERIATLEKEIKIIKKVTK